MRADTGPFPGSPSAVEERTTSPCPACGASAFTPVFRKQGWTFVRCDRCTHMRLDPLPTPALLSAVYEDSYRAGLYASFAAATDVRSATADARVARLRPLVRPGPWLDVGCSTGTLLEAAGRVGIDAEGLDLSAEAVAAARARGLRATCSAVEDFTPTRRFACITAFDVVEHLIEPAALLRRLGDWLLPEGRLVVTVPDIGSPLARLMGRRWYFYAPPVHIHYFNRHTIARLIERSGFRLVQIGTAHKIMTLDYILATIPAFLPALTRVTRTASRLVPRGARRRLRRVPVGELLVVAQAGAPSGTG